MHATVFVPEGKVGHFVRKFEAYIKQTPGKIETPQLDVDLYTPIATQIGVPVDAVIEV
jgi:hypothetical protein